MHMQGEPRGMQDAPHYDDVVGDVHRFLAERLFACEMAGIAKKNLVVDPGFGFGKTLDHNLLLLRQLARLADLGVPVLAGLSRKRSARRHHRPRAWTSACSPRWPPPCSPPNTARAWCACTTWPPPSTR